MLHEYIGGAHFNYMKIFFLRTLLFDHLFLISVVEHLSCFLYLDFSFYWFRKATLQNNLSFSYFLLLFENFAKGFILIFNMKAPSSKFS